MTSVDQSKALSTLTGQLADLFAIESTFQQSNRIQIHLSYRYEHARSRGLLVDRLKLGGYDYTIRDTADGLILDIDPKPKLRIPTINIVLFVVTVLSVYLVPVFLLNEMVAGSYAQAFQGMLDDLSSGVGLVFTMAMISILLVHEMGHFVASRRRGIITSWPYFLPAPNIIGSFGAIIKSKSPFWNRRDLIEVGASGPIAGWVVAMVWLVWGLSQSYTITPDDPLVKSLVFSLDGESILVKLLVPILIGPAPTVGGYVFSEAAFAGWVGLLITAINLLPIGQLDGGHITYGLGRKLQTKLGWIAMAGLVVLGYYSPMWWLFAAMGLIFKVRHAPTLDDSLPPSRVSVLMGIAAWIILALSFTPVPFRVG